MINFLMTLGVIVSIIIGLGSIGFALLVLLLLCIPKDIEQ